MYVGIGIFLLVVGAILTFAVDATVAGVDSLIGWILMAGGTLAIILSLALGRRAGYSARRVSTRDPVTGMSVEEERVDPALASVRDRSAGSTPRPVGGRRRPAALCLGLGPLLRALLWLAPESAAHHLLCERVYGADPDPVLVV